MLAYDATVFTAAVDTVEITHPWLKTGCERVFGIRLIERTAGASAKQEFRLTAAK